MNSVKFWWAASESKPKVEVMLNCETLSFLREDTGTYASDRIWRTVKVNWLRAESSAPLYASLFKEKSSGAATMLLNWNAKVGGEEGAAEGGENDG